MQRICLDAIPQLKDLPVLDASDFDAMSIVHKSRINEIAEATDVNRLDELLHRKDYLPIAAIRYVEDGESSLRVYFKRSISVAMSPVDSQSAYIFSEFARRRLNRSDVENTKRDSVSKYDTLMFAIAMPNSGYIAGTYSGSKDDDAVEMAILPLVSSIAY